LKNVTLNQTPTGVNLLANTTVWLSHVTQTSVPSFTATVAVNRNGQGTAYSDGTNILMGDLEGGGLSTLTLQ
jgi:hypothetical protein